MKFEIQNAVSFEDTLKFLKLSLIADRVKQITEKRDY
jgi:hypothetical protein